MSDPDSPPARSDYLSREEAILWQVARQWRSGVSEPCPVPERLVRLAIANKAQNLLAHALDVDLLRSELGPDTAHKLDRALRKHAYLADHLGAALCAYLRFAAAEGQEVVVIKGLWLCEKLYGDPAMRPGADIDLLLRRRDIPASLRLLEEKMDYGRWWRPLLDDRYYYRHHLHQQRANHDRTIWIEPHWLLDHPYSQLTIDVDAMLDRARPDDLWGLPVRVLDWPDLLISLCVHLVKHAVYLPYCLDRPDLPRLILADGMLMYYVDVAEAVRRAGPEPPWADLVVRANAGGAGAIVAAVLTVCVRFLETPVPPEVLRGFNREVAGSFTRRVMHRLADAETAAYLGEPVSGLWPFLLGYRHSLVFRPVRLLDLVHYLWPRRDYLRRRYGRDGFRARTGHMVRAAGQYLRVALDTVRFTAQRRLEVRRLDRAGYQWPPDPVYPFNAPTAPETQPQPTAPSGVGPVSAGHS